MQIQKYTEQSLISKNFDSSQDNEDGFDELWCRTCCEKISLRFLHLLTNEANVPSLSNMLSEIAKIDVKTKNGDGFPEHICDNCVYRLKIAYNFVLQAQQSNEYFEQMTCMLLKQNLNNSQQTPITMTENLTCKSEFYDEFANIEKSNVDTNSESYENIFEDVTVKDETLLDEENNDEALVKSMDIPSPNIEMNNDDCRRKNDRKIVYMQTRKLNNKRYVWNPAAEQALFELWESNLKHLTQTRRKGHIYNEISEQLSSIGFYHSAREVQVKINNMTQKYRKENRKIKSSAESQSMWIHYERVKRIIGDFKCKNIEQLQTENVDVCLDDSISIDVNIRTQSSLSRITDRSGLMPPSPSYLESTSPISLESSMVESTPTSPKPKRRKSNSFQQRILTNSKKSKETPISLTENLTWEPDDNSDSDAQYEMKNIKAQSINIGTILQSSKNSFKNNVEQKDEMTSGVENEKIKIKDLCLNESITSEKLVDTPLPIIKINHNRKYKSKTYQNIAMLLKRKQKEKLYSINQKRDVWSPTAERALLEIWELNSYRLNRTRKNGHVHKEISAELSKLGFVHNPREVQVKINNMTQKYRKENRKIKSSAESQSMWMHYERVKRIIGDFKCKNIGELQTENVDVCLDDSISIDVNARTQSSLSRITDRSGLMPPSPSYLESTTPISLESSMVESTPTSPKPKRRKSNSFQQRILTNSKKSKENLTWEPDDNSDSDEQYEMKNIKAESINIGTTLQSTKNPFKNNVEQKDKMSSGVENEKIKIKDLCLNESIPSEKLVNTPLSNIKINHNRKYKSKTYQSIALLLTRKQKEKLYSINQKRDVWSPTEERALLEIWELNSCRLSRTRKNGHVHKEISAELSKLGFVHNPREVQVKMNNMIQKYRKQNRELQFSGASETVWTYYESLKRIIGDLECENKKQFQVKSFNVARLQDPIIVKSMESPIPDTVINNITSCKSKTHQKIVSLRNRKRKKIYQKNNKRYAWSREAEQALFKLWKSNLKHILGTHRKEHIYIKISVQLAKIGFHYSAREIQVKINNITQIYRKENRKIEFSGDSRSMWVHYETVKSIIGDFKS
ncbi:uncharacterized protein LOC119675803 isoform X2 [Teleopsis dalmanni]|uniref:uncharacterized protein LOC119675803 isoform X2 n=1 Tax=Teleopsis dalmanni TaxID=139649 RepID=UPI0018CD816E|nr:uncharacterized protein LOC119675803 isoform X2 [Teleopsis dalmanni]